MIIAQERPYGLLVARWVRETSAALGCTVVSSQPREGEYVVCASDSSEPVSVAFSPHVLHTANSVRRYLEHRIRRARDGDNAHRPIA